jgi:hypothetical protein
MKRIILLALPTLAIACADGTLPPRAADDPSNPDASETPTELPSASPALGPAAAAEGGSPNPSGHEHHHPTPLPSDPGRTQ